MKKETFTPAMVQEIETIILGKKVQELNEIIDIQKQSLSIEDQYNAVLYNGLILANSILTGVEPVFYPDVIKENKKEEIKEEQEVVMPWMMQRMLRVM